MDDDRWILVVCTTEEQWRKNSTTCAEEETGGVSWWSKSKDISQHTESTIDELQSKGPCVLVDPNWRDILYAMHEDSTAANPRIYRYTSMSRRRNSGKKVARRRQAHEVANEPLVGAALVTLSQTTYMSTSRATYESHVTQTLNEFYGREIFRKLRFRCSMLQRHEDRLANDLRWMFANAVLVFGDTSIGNRKYHPPTPCLGLRDLLQRKSFEILLIDKHLTSSRCPSRSWSY